MRCILTVNFSPWSRYSGGGQRSTHNLACALRKRGHRVTVVYTKPPWEDVPTPHDLPYEIVWAPMALARRTTPPFVAREVRALLTATERDEPVVVHGNGEEAARIPSLLRSARPFAFVMTPRYPNFPALLQRAPAERGALALAAVAVLQTKYIWLGLALRGAHWVCPTSEHSSAMVARAYGLDTSRMTVVYNGISEEFLRPAALALEEPQLREFIARGPFAIYFGRLSKEKGIHTLLDALARPEGAGLRVVFAGRGPELARLEARAKELGLAGRVCFTSWLDAKQMAALVARASFALLPSHEESFGNTMAESMALGVPVVSTTAGSIPEVVRHEQDGLLVAPGDAQALAAAASRLAADPELRRTLGAAGRARAVANFTWDASAERFERIYERALEELGQLRRNG